MEGRGARPSEGEEQQQQQLPAAQESRPMPIQVKCPSCGRILTASRRDAGRPALCNACGQCFTIPHVTPAHFPAAPPTPAVTPPARHRYRRTVAIAGAIAIVLAISAVTVAILHKRGGRGGGGGEGSWESQHRAAIVAMIEDADSRVIAGDLAGAANIYRQVDQAVAGRALHDPTLRAALELASAQERKVLAALSSRPEPAATQPAATQPVAAAPELEPAGPPTSSTTIASGAAGKQSALLAHLAHAAAHAADTIAASPPTPATTTSTTIQIRTPTPPVALAIQPTTAPSHSLLHPRPASQPAATDATISDEQIGQSIQRGVDWLIPRFDPKTHLINPNRHIHEVHHSLDALCVYALLQSGMAIHDDRLNIHKPFMSGLLDTLDLLQMEKDTTTYGRALRATALALYCRKEDMNALRADVNWLVKAQKGGAYGYADITNDPLAWDNSNSQYGLLGVWSGAEAGAEVPLAYWNAVQKHWTETQQSDGSWGYHTGGSLQSMTVAGVASLFVCHDYLDAAQSGDRVGRPPFSPALANGLTWLEQGDRVLEKGMLWGYSLYGVERVGLASGFKFFGSHDWYREIARIIVERQLSDGSWGEEVNTAYALLFLARGRHPILMNKLRFDGYWANRPRDAANLARFAGKELERPLNWQVVSIDRDWTDWTDSPILYISSHVAPKFSDEQFAKIRSFVEAGGLLYTQTDGGGSNGAAFESYVHDLAKRLFPRYPMATLPRDHPVYSMLYKLAPPPPLQVVSNGVRALMIHSPQDLAMAWQQRADRSKPAAFQLGVNLFLYAAGKSDLKNRIASSVLPEHPSATGGTMPIARLRYGGDGDAAANWDPEPAAWPRFAAWFGWQTGCGLAVAPVDLAALQPQSVPLAHLTGTAGFKPTDAQASAVRHFVDSGGVLLIDSAGGSATFAASATQLLAMAFPDTPLKKLPPSHPLFSAATLSGMADLVSPPGLRRYAANQLGRDAGAPEGLSHGKGHVVFTSLDLTSGLLNTNTWGILGYSSDYAQSFLKNLILWTASGAPQPQPAH
jgi:hypothetical protein